MRLRTAAAALATTAATVVTTGLGFGVASASAATVGCAGFGTHQTGYQSAVSNYSYIFHDPDGTVRGGSSLGQAVPGDVVTATFTVSSACTTVDVSFASYKVAAPFAGDYLAFFKGQTLYDSATGTFAGGSTGSLTIKLPPVSGSSANCPNKHAGQDNGYGHGANVSGPYDSTCDGSPSLNGNGNGNANGKPCAGCVGNADNKNPKGQLPNATADGNNGYECDNNNGVGKTNPAHSGCSSGNLQADLAVGSVINPFCPANATDLSTCTFYGHELVPVPGSPTGYLWGSALLDSVFL